MRVVHGALSASSCSAAEAERVKALALRWTEAALPSAAHTSELFPVQKKKKKITAGAPFLKPRPHLPCSPGWLTQNKYS